MTFAKRINCLKSNEFYSGWIQPVGLRGPISVTLVVKSHKGFATVRGMKYTSQY